MRKRLLAVTLSVMMTASMLAGCGGKADTKDTKKVQEEQDASKEEGTAEDSSEKKNAAEDAGNFQPQSLQTHLAVPLILSLSVPTSLI